jgi:hypothetical protein
MCGKVSGQEDELPALWHQLNEKNLTKTDKQANTSKALTSTIHWRDAKVKLLTPPIFKNIVIAALEEKPPWCPFYVTVKGLTPFAVPCLTEAEAFSLNELAEAMASAPSTDIKDIYHFMVEINSYKLQFTLCQPQRVQFYMFEGFMIQHSSMKFKIQMLRSFSFPLLQLPLSLEVGQCQFLIFRRDRLF